MGTKVRNHGNQGLKTWESGLKPRLENMELRFETMGKHGNQGMKQEPS